MARGNAVSAANVPQIYTGLFRFPGTYAFIEKYNIADYALLQEDAPFTGTFNREAAENTNLDLQANHSDGDPATLSGKLVTVDVEGRPTPVLFMFD
jgi:hypothetical protein